MLVKILPIIIEEPWWGAWKKFGWDKSTWGIGIKRNKVEAAMIAGYTHFQIHIEERNTDYLISIDEVEKYAIANGTMFKDKMGVILYVVPENMLVPMETENEKIG